MNTNRRYAISGKILDVRGYICGMWKYYYLIPNVSELSSLDRFCRFVVPMSRTAQASADTFATS